jgi:hypothetical protein
LTFHDAFKEALVLVLNRNRPLARKKGLHIRDLTNEHFYAIKGNYGRALFDYKHDFCRKHGFEPNLMTALDTAEAAALILKLLCTPGEERVGGVRNNGHPHLCPVATLERFKDVVPPAHVDNLMVIFKPTAAPMWIFIQGGFN